MESQKLVQFIKSQVVDELNAHGKTVADTSSYSIFRKTNGMFSIYIFFSGKIMKGSDVKASIQLDNSHHTAKLAIDAMEELYHESTSSSMLERMRTMAQMSKQEPSKKSW